ncbi:MAG: SAM-dependent methyltransferase [Paracoccaceae bacterium]|nr:SAM-dependent methyltransferase [Paracoccaceae bacterium]MDE2917135.1 SAM-dependent methyltransferase [Paracoccaceae bacterium]
MKYFPLFLDLAEKKVAISGAGETAVPKIRLLLKTDARIEVFGKKPAPDVINWHNRGKLSFHDREIKSDDLQGCVLLYGTNNNPKEDRKVLALGEAKGVLVNIVDNLQLSQFITPAIVDRDPITVAIGTEGTAPVLARKIKARVEDLLPESIGRVAKISTTFRERVASKLSSLQIRSFWSSYFERILTKKILEVPEGELLENLEETLENYDPDHEEQSVYYFVESSTTSPDLLTVKARRLIENADVVFYDSQISKFILELARREAILVDLDQRTELEGQSRQQIIASICQEFSHGETILQLGSNSLQMWESLGSEMAEIEDLGIKFEFVPGVSPIKTKSTRERSGDLLSVFLDDRSRWKNGVNLSSIHHKQPKSTEGLREQYSNNLIGELASVESGMALREN